MAGPLLVHRAGGDLLGGVLGPTALDEALLDVLVLPLALLAPRLLGHDDLLVIVDAALETARPAQMTLTTSSTSPMRNNQSKPLIKPPTPMSSASRTRITTTVMAALYPNRRAVTLVPPPVPCTLNRRTPMIDPDVAFNHGVAHRLALALATVVVGQTLPSESDVPFEPFTLAFDRHDHGDGGVVRTGARRRARARRRHQPGQPGSSSASPRAPTTRARSRCSPSSSTSCGAASPALKQVFVRGDGVVEVPFFLFGRLAGGPLVGLRSIAIETCAACAQGRRAPPHVELTSRTHVR